MRSRRARRVQRAVAEGTERVGNIPLRDVVSRRTWLVLENADLKTVREVSQRTEPDLLKFRNFGKKALNELKDALGGLGIRLPGTGLTEVSQYPIRELLRKAGYTDATVGLFEEMFSALGAGFRIARRG